MRKARVPILLITIFLALVYLAYQGESRLELVGTKLSGNLPNLSMPDVLRAILPRRLIVPLGSRTIGEIKVKRNEGQGACEVLWQTPIGEFWGHEGDREVLSFTIFEQLVSKNYQNSAVSIRPGDIVVDVGSHLGVFTRAALNSGASTVVSIEPAPRNIQCFQKTFAEELRDGKVRLVEAAAWETGGKIRFSTEAEGLEAARGQVEQDGEMEVDAVTIDGVVAELGLTRVDFIKMDIEGAERFALRGAGQTLRNVRPQMALCTYHRSDDRAALRAVSAELNPKYEFTQSLHYLYVR